MNIPKNQQISIPSSAAIIYIVFAFHFPLSCDEIADTIASFSRANVKGNKNDEGRDKGEA